MSPANSSKNTILFTFLCAFGMVGIFLFISNPSKAEVQSTLYVTTAADEIIEDQFCSLREAIISTNNDNAGLSGCDDGDTDDTILFMIDDPIELNSTLPQIAGPLTIDGAHLVGDVPLSQTIDGNGYQIFTLGSGYTLTLKNLTIQNGSESYGGAVDNEGSKLTIEKSKFANNYASVYGGAIYQYNGTLILTDTLFSANTAYDKGGAIYTYSGTLIITDSRFNENHGGNGGGIDIENGKASIVDSTFDHNISEETTDGGAIHNFAANLNVSESTFSENSANYGGAISTNQGPTTVTNSTFFSNTAIIQGGAISLYELSSAMSSLKVIASTFIANHTNNRGGAISNEGGNAVWITNSTFYTNAATNAGAAIFHSSYDTMTITHSTLANNVGGHGIEFWLNLVMRNSIITTKSGENCHGGEAISGENNLQYGGYSFTCDDFEVGNPMLGPLGDHGGPTWTMLPSINSPAIDRIAAAGGCGVGVNTDQRGVPRPIRSLCDIGAVENNQFCFLPIIFR